MARQLDLNSVEFPIGPSKFCYVPRTPLPCWVLIKLTLFVYFVYIEYPRISTGMAKKSRKIVRIVDAFRKAERKLRSLTRRVRKVNGPDNMQNIGDPPEQVWACTLPNLDEVGDSDNGDSMNTAQRERQHFKVEGRVDEWLERCQTSDGDWVVDEEELTNLYNTCVEEEPWPEHLLDVDAPPVRTLGDEVPTFEQLEFKRRMALTETQEMGWEIRLEETLIHGMEPVHAHLSGGDW